MQKQKHPQGRKPIYPFGEMAVGDIQEFPAPGGGAQSKAVRAAHKYGERNGMKFLSETQPCKTLVRIRRVA